MGYGIDVHRAVYALSDALDMVGVEDIYHGKRVALMVTACARTLGWTDEQTEFLYLCALIHDCGVSSTRLRCDLITRFDADGIELHGHIGYDYLSSVPGLKAFATPILYHHTRWDALERMQAVIDPAILLTANLISLADRADALLAQQVWTGRKIDPSIVLAVLREHRGSMFKPELVDAISELLQDEAFQAVLHPDAINRSIEREAFAWPPVPLDLREIHSVAALFGRIVDAKSPFTAQHSEGVARLARLLAEKLALSEESCAHVEVAGLMHDVGKLGVPDEILEKPGRLSPQEWIVMRRHSLDTYRLLVRLVGEHPIAAWAACHHETLRGDGYPFGVSGEDLSIETRIIAAADIFQALAQERPYRKSLSITRIMDILHDMACDNRIDGAVVAVLRENLTECRLAACHRHLMDGVEQAAA